MKYYRLFFWGNGDKSEELTQYLVPPIFYEDRLNERLDSGEIVLDSVPVSLKKSFAPKTKLRLERYLTSDFSDEPSIWDLEVEHDDVEIYEGEPLICCHRVNVIETSVVGQGMHIDNISLTYELQDVNLGYRTVQESQEPSPITECDLNFELLRETRYEDSDEHEGWIFTSHRKGYFKNGYKYSWQNKESISNLIFNLHGSEAHTISFAMPSLFCQGTYDGSTWVNLFEMNTILKIYRYRTVNGSIDASSKTLILQREGGGSSFTTKNDDLYYSDGNIACLRLIDTSIRTRSLASQTKFSDIYLRTNTLAQAGNYNKQISFTTDILSDAELESGLGYLYFIEIKAKPINQDAMLLRYEVSFDATTIIDTAVTGGIYDFISFPTNNKGLVSEQDIYLNVNFCCVNLYSDVVYAPMLTKGVKYSCYDLLRKALLTIDTQIIDNEETGIDDIEYSVILDPLWENRLKTAKVQETILETKNLWEVLLQIGYYLHAIPYFEFAKDGTDRFVLSFRQLGDTKKKLDTSQKITVFNSKNLSEYFTQYDSYVTNIFSPQNLVEEWLVIKTTDSSYLVSNNTSILKTTYGISEIVEFDITYDGSVGGQAGTASALSHIFEKSIYQILTADYNISPGMGDSIYYELGQNTISGLTYIPPSPNNDMPMALKRIVGKLFSGVRIAELKFNNLKFHIKYRTQDSMRVSQVRPDLKNFVKNSSYEKYPHHEQFFGQQDKIVDSERFSLNLFGKLVRVGNDIYQCQEMVVDGNEKESGDLVEIDGEPYYVTEVENEFYPEMTLQKVTYSKNFNQLSQIVTIPSEPRFYEVSERSKIRREKREFDFLEISTAPNNDNLVPTFMPANTWQSFIKKLIFNKESVVLPNYAWTRFKVDKKRVHKGSYGQYVPNEQMFPSSELDRTNPSEVLPKSSSDHADVIVPVLHFPMKDGIVFEWDMEDNFKAGDSIDTSISGTGNTDDEAYYAMQSVRYCDVLGRADLYTFRLFNKTDWNREQSQALPKACIEPTENQSIFYLPAAKSIALDKDCREALSFNYQISLLHRNDDGQGDFITFTNLFGTKESELHCCLLDDEVSMFNENTNVIPANVLADNVIYNLVENLQSNQLEIHFETPNVDLSKVKSVVFYEIDSNGNKVSYLAKNFKDGLVDSIPTFYIFSAYSD